MKKIYLLSLVLAVCFIGLSAQVTKAQIAGGYGSVETSDKEVKAAARQAVSTESKRLKHTLTLISISKAEQQVVAGMNYKVCLKVRDGRRTRRATAVVFKSLRGRRSLSSWDWGNCDW